MSFFTLKWSVLAILPIFDSFYGFFHGVFIVSLHGSIHSSKFYLSLEILFNVAVPHCSKLKTICWVPQLQYVYQRCLQCFSLIVWNSQVMFTKAEWKSFQRKFSGVLVTFIWSFDRQDIKKFFFCFFKAMATAYKIYVSFFHANEVNELAKQTIHRYYFFISACNHFIDMIKWHFAKMIYYLFIYLFIYL